MPPAVRLSARLAVMTPVSSRRRPPYVGGVLVVPQALEPRVAQLPVGRPLAEAHLGDEARLDPVHPRSRQVTAIERGLVPLQAGQRRVQAVQGSLVEAGADLAGVDELSVLVVVAEQTRPEPRPRPLPVGQAADDARPARLAPELPAVPC